MAMFRTSGNTGGEINGAVLRIFAAHVTKPEVRAALENPKMEPKLVSTNSAGLLELYGYHQDAAKAMATVLTKKAHQSLKLEEDGKPNGILEEAVKLYLSNKVTDLCQESAAAGIDKMIYSIEMLHDAMGSDANTTLGVIERINREGYDKAFWMLVVQNIRTRVAGIGGINSKMEIAASAIEDMREFKESLKDR
ncbi:MAG: hypothetical protein KGH61_04245 [Candidatus Micrarchaeota archaeon]|nr:hypothetical protein [Candidatus Micrarchaeota archaeon]MDE1848130.1 hypothetical protein [Candidatus Micrarchaeota archaeon]MDE1864785.1 hypothetical protein [Candidatus Micrarchaeota archaeon]